MATARRTTAARALLYLARTQARNRWRWRLRRLRQPRYLLGGVAALAYLGWVSWGASAGRATSRPAALVTWALPLTVALHWIGRPNPLALAFSPAEVHFLFAAPVTRRTLIHARLLGQQAASLLLIVVWVALFDPVTTLAGVVPRALGAWVLVTAVTLHRTGAALSLIEIPDAPRRLPIARTVAIAWCCALAGAVVYGWRSLGPLLTDEWGPLLATAWRLRDIAELPLPRAILTPVRWLGAPALATQPLAALAALPLALAVLAALYAWVVRDPRPFEEAAADATRRYAERIAAVRRGAFRRPRAAEGGTGRTSRIPLPRGGPAALAFAWKSVVATARAHSPRNLALFAGALAVGAWVMPLISPDPVDAAMIRAAFVASGFAAAFIALPGWFRQDLRAELGHLVFLKTAPIPSRDIVAAQTATAALLAWFALVLVFAVPLSLVAMGDSLLGFRATLLLLAEALVVALPVLVLLHFTVHNAFAIVFPGWARVGQAGAGGLQAMGQAYLTLAAVLLALALLLALPVGAGALAALAVDGALALAVAIPVAALVAIVEWWLLCAWLGRQLERVEPDALIATSR
ncbi:MAG: hypothetical protein MUF21_10560 [Gemmatimonadaceae bacterium]|nr:hypothetical protein [Gemmatimonadaceae bacterium]